LPAPDDIFDYIIVGAGSAGCVLAERLSAGRRRQVLLIEAGPEDKSPLIAMPKGIGQLLADPRHVWAYPLDEGMVGGKGRSFWLRGKALGGSSSVNGMIYTRGDPSDYDDWAARGLDGWDWGSMGEAFAAIEDHALGPGPWRGVGGPLRISTVSEPNAVCDAFLAAGAALGLKVKDDLNDPHEQEGIGYCARTISHGRRWSAAEAFLKPARGRPNLTVVTGAQADTILFEGLRAIGVSCRVHGGRRDFRCGRELILAAGALGSPKLLQLSGVGPAGPLKAAGVEVRLDRPAVGAHLREHRVIFMQYRLARPALSHNREFAGARLAGNVAKYALTRKGVMSLAAYEAGAFVRSRPELERPDVQLLMAPFSLTLGGDDPGDVRPETPPGLQCIALPVRPTSEGELSITAADPDAPLEIRPNFLATEEDRTSAVGAVRYVRALMGQAPMAGLIDGETVPGPGARTDDEILAAYGAFGSPGYHAVGVCRMGADEAAVVDARLRVRGVGGLRIADCSVMPTIPSGNTNGPVMALAWRAADLILAEAPP
jgi:choline dehydrogenase-like flavoprotein